MNNPQLKAGDLPDDVKDQLLGEVRKRLGPEKYFSMVSALGEDGLIDRLIAAQASTAPSADLPASADLPERETPWYLNFWLYLILFVVLLIFFGLNADQQNKPDDGAFQVLARLFRWFGTVPSWKWSSKVLIGLCGVAINILFLRRPRTHTLQIITSVIGTAIGPQGDCGILNFIAIPCWFILAGWAFTVGYISLLLSIMVGCPILLIWGLVEMCL